MASFERELHDIQLTAIQHVHKRGRIVRLQSGEESLDAIKLHAVQWYFHTVGFVNALRHLYDRCDIPEMRGELAESLYEEETGKITGTQPHLDLYFQFAASIGITREMLESSAYMLPELGALINWYHYAATALSTVEGLAVLAIAAEGNNARVGNYEGAVKLTGEALQTHYRLSEKDVEFYTVHAYADEDHAAMGVRNVAKFTKGEAQKERVRTCLATTYDAFAGLARLESRSWDECWKRPSAPLYGLSA